MDKATATAAMVKAPMHKVLAEKTALAAVRVKATAAAKAAMVRVRVRAKVRVKARARAKVRVRARAKVGVASKVAAAAWAVGPPAAAVRTRCRRVFRMAATTTSSPVSCAKLQ